MKPVFGIVKPEDTVYTVNHQAYARLNGGVWELRFDIDFKVGEYRPLEDVEKVWLDAAILLFADPKFPDDLRFQLEMWSTMYDPDPLE